LFKIVNLLSLPIIGILSTQLVKKQIGISWSLLMVTLGAILVSILLTADLLFQIAQSSNGRRHGEADVASSHDKESTSRGQQVECFFVAGLTRVICVPPDVPPVGP
jgi:hypothetical protein